MIARTAERLGIEPARLAADTGYGSAEMLGWLVEERGIEPHIPVFDKSARTDGSLSRADFTYDHAGDTYTCPRGKLLTTRGTLVNNGATLIYRASKFDCDACDLRPRCCPNTPARKVPRSIYEGARDMAREIAETDAYVVSRRERKEDRDAVRPSQTHSQAGPAATAGPLRRPRRVPPCRNSPEPTQARQTDPAPSARNGLRAAADVAKYREGHARPAPFSTSSIVSVPTSLT